MTITAKTLERLRETLQRLPAAVVIPSSRRLDFTEANATLEACLLAHLDAVEAGQPGYRDPMTGFFVMTATQHLERGSCCESGCRHCPWEDRGAEAAELVAQLLDEHE